MARCEQGYLCRICGLDVAEITESDLYLRYVLGEVPPEQLHLLPECHVRCNPSTAQHIVDPAFPPLVCDGPFAKTLLDAAYVAEEEGACDSRLAAAARITIIWESQLSTIRFQPLVLILKAKQRLIGIEIKHRLSRSSPMAGVKEEDGRGVASCRPAATPSMSPPSMASNSMTTPARAVKPPVARSRANSMADSHSHAFRAGRAAYRWRRRPRRRRLAIAVDDAGTGRGPRARRPTFAIAATTISSLRLWYWCYRPGRFRRRVWRGSRYNHIMRAGQTIGNGMRPMRAGT